MKSPFQPFVFSMQNVSPIFSTGDASSDEVSNKFYDKAVFYLDITGDDFTTLDVNIEWYEPSSGQWLILFSFAQVSGVASEKIVWGDIVADEYLPGRLRASWDLVGTDATFTVGGEMR